MSLSWTVLVGSICANLIQVVDGIVINSGDPLDNSPIGRLAHNAEGNVVVMGKTECMAHLMDCGAQGCLVAGAC